jgi:hypothetical protein
MREDLIPNSPVESPVCSHPIRHLVSKSRVLACPVGSVQGTTAVGGKVRGNKTNYKLISTENKLNCEKKQSNTKNKRQMSPMVLS